MRNYQVQILTWKCKLAPLASSWRWQLHWQLHTISKIAPTPTPRWLLQQKLHTLQAHKQTHKHSKSVVWDKWEWEGSLIAWRGCFWRENTFTSPPKPLNHKTTALFFMNRWACHKPAGFYRLGPKFGQTRDLTGFLGRFGPASYLTGRFDRLPVFLSVF